MIPTRLFRRRRGPTDSYIAANFNNAGFGGNGTNFLLLPALVLQTGDTLTFWTRTETAAFPGDNPQILLSTNGSNTTLSDFSANLLQIGGAGYGNLDAIYRGRH